MRIRHPAVAGTFYPGEPIRLETAVRGYLAAARSDGERLVKALIAPHAGFVYSGPVAATAYACLAARADQIERVVLLGPAHRVYLEGLAVPAADAFATPLGSVPIDREAVAALLELPQVTVSDRAHAWEHSLEVQLPFLQLVLSDFRLVPLVVGDATPRQVEEVLDLLWGGAETLVVVSSDLSHYHDYATAQSLDAHTSRAIEALDPDAIGEESACGRIPLQGLLRVARRRGLAAAAIDVRSSGDTAGSRDSVVGYGAYLLA
jgi:MEMO1 family protein